METQVVDEAAIIWASGLTDALKVGIGGFIGYGATWLTNRYQKVRETEARQHQENIAALQVKKDSVRQIYKLVGSLDIATSQMAFSERPMKLEKLTESVRTTDECMSELSYLVAMEVPEARAEISAFTLAVKQCQSTITTLHTTKLSTTDDQALELYFADYTSVHNAKHEIGRVLTAENLEIRPWEEVAT